MIIVTVTLHSAVTGQQTELGKAIIYNDGDGTHTRGNYTAHTIVKGKPIARQFFNRTGFVKNHARLREPVWSLVGKAIKEMGYNL